MNKVVLLLTLFFSINTFADVATDIDDVTMIPDPNVIYESQPLDFNPLMVSTTDKERVAVAVARAHAILSLALKHSSVEWRPIYTTVKNSLNKSMVRWPVRGRNFTFCVKRPNVLAFVYRGTKDIHLCRRVFQEGWIQNKELGQTLIHEAAHVRGITNECLATTVEISAMRHSREGVSYENNYWKGCGLK